MRWRSAVAVLAVLAGSAACSDGPEEHTAAGVPVRWYTTVDDALAEQPNVGTVAILENGGPCPLRGKVVLAGKKVSKVSDHGVVRLDRTIPAVLCSWYEDTVVGVQDVVIDGRTVRVVRIVHPTNPTAGTTLTATLLDEASRGRVRLEVGRTQEIDGYDEHSIATDLVAYLAG